MRVSPIQLSKCLTLYSEEYKQFPIIDTFLRNLLYDNLIFHCGKAYRSIDIGKQMAFVSEPLEDEGNTSYHLLTHTHYFLLLKMSVAAFNEANYPLCMCGGDTTSPPYMHAQWGGRAWIECNGNLKEIAYRPKENGYTYFFPRPAKTKKKIWKALLQQIDTITNDLHAGGTFTVSFDGRSDIKNIFLIQTQDDLPIVIMPCRRFRDDECYRNVDK